MSITTSTAFTAFRRFEETREVRGKKQPARESLRKLEAQDKIFIVGMVLENPSLYLQEICQDVADVLGKQVSAPTICCVLVRHEFTRKKSSKLPSNEMPPSEQHLQLRSCIVSTEICWCGSTKQVATSGLIFESLDMLLRVRRWFTIASYIVVSTYPP